MALSTKGWGVAAAGVLVVGAGGYVAAQAMVGNQVEQALADSFAELDRSVSYEVHDVQIDKGLFDTRATATIAMRGFEDATADVNLFVKHGALSADITGDIVPNQALVQGIIDIDLKATRSAIAGQLSAAELDGVALDVLVDQLVVGLDRGADGHWHLDTRAQEITYHGDNETVRMATPRLILNTRHHEGEPVLLQSLDIPRTEIFVEGVRVYLEGMESESESRGETIVHQSGHFRIAEMGVDDTSFGSLAFEVSADNWDLEALQAFQEAYAPLMAMHLDAEERGVPVDAEQERVLMAEALESSYAMLVASPTMAIDPCRPISYCPTGNRLQASAHYAHGLRRSGPCQRSALRCLLAGWAAVTRGPDERRADDEPLRGSGVSQPSPEPGVDRNHTSRSGIGLYSDAICRHAG